MKNNPLNSLSKFQAVNDNMVKSRSSVRMGIRPLSEIQNSIDKAKKKIELQKSKSKQNTPDYQRKKCISRSSSKSKNLYFNRYPEKTKTFIELKKSNIEEPHLKRSSQHNGQLSKGQGSPLKSSSQINNNSSITESYSSTTDFQYQLSSNLTSQKSVKFSSCNLQTNLFGIQKLPKPKMIPKRTSSILKNRQSSCSQSSMKSDSSIRSKGQGRGASRTKDLIIMETQSSNKSVKSKYLALLSKYKDLNKRFSKNIKQHYSKLQKYTDDMFPPQNSSIFSYSIHSKTQKSKMYWKRIPQLFPDNTLSVVREQECKSKIKIVKGKTSLAEQYLLMSLNCIRQNKKILFNIFQDQELSLFGIYLLKIFQQNSWKYIIVDDLIPAKFDELTQSYSPAFINIQSSEGTNSNELEIWPFLIEKAYASYYSKYQALRYGSQISFVQQLTGIPAQPKTISKKQQEKQSQINNLYNILVNQKACVLGQNVLENGQKSFMCIFPDLNVITKKQSGCCSALTADKNYKTNRIKLQLLLKNLQKIHIFNTDVPTFHSLLNFSSESKKQSKKSTRFRPQTSLNTLNTEQSSEIVQMCFKIAQVQNCILSVSQKDSKFYFQGKDKYQYAWVRAVLLLKEFNDEFRWIRAKYSSEKWLNMHLKLEPGQYKLLIMPEWKSVKKSNMTVNIYSSVSLVELQRQPYIAQEQIFEKGCTDIAQREGSLNQINKQICAYNYVNQQSALVVQNINNQRQKGPVTVMRSISGLVCQVQLIPVNKEFYYQINSDYDQNSAKKKMKKTIQVNIPAGKCFTVVLKTVGGIDHNFFKSFDFGS